MKYLALITGPTPTQRADRAAAELAYWRESVQFAADMLFRGRSQTINWPNDAINVEAYLRQLLTLDDDTPAPSDPPDTPCYDCRTTGERLAELEEAIQADIQERFADRKQLHSLANRLDALEALAAPAIAKLGQRLEELEAWQIAAAQDGDDDNTLFQIYDAVARRERAKAAGGA